MAKLYKEDQRYHDLFTISLLLVLGLFMIYNVIVRYFILEMGIPSSAIAVLVVSAIGVILFYKNLKYKIRISSKKLTVKIDPLPWMRIKVNKKEVEGIEFFKVSQVELCSGWAMNFGQRCRVFNFGDRKGIIVRKTNGRQVVVFSKKLYEQRTEITALLEKHNWKVAVFNS